MYRDPIIQKLEDTVKESTGIFKAIYHGDPVRVPTANLPALVIAKDNTQAREYSTGEDEHVISFIATVITDIRDDVNDDKELVAGVNTLYDIVEGRNEDYTLKNGSLLSILRRNQNLDGAQNLRIDLGNPTEVNYTLTVGRRGARSWSVEAEVEFTCHYIQLKN